MNNERKINEWGVRRRNPGQAYTWYFHCTFWEGVLHVCRLWRIRAKCWNNNEMHVSISPRDRIIVGIITTTDLKITGSLIWWKNLKKPSAILVLPITHKEGHVIPTCVVNRINNKQILCVGGDFTGNRMLIVTRGKDGVAVLLHFGVSLELHLSSNI